MLVFLLVVVPNVVGHCYSSHSYPYGHNKVSADLVSLDSSVEFYALEHDGELPPDLQTLCPRYLDIEGPPLDPWGRQYQYEIVEGEPKILTLGRDGRPGGTGQDTDLSNIDLRRRFAEFASTPDSSPK